MSASHASQFAASLLPDEVDALAEQESDASATAAHAPDPIMDSDEPRRGCLIEARAIATVSEGDDEEIGGGA